MFINNSYCYSCCCRFFLIHNKKYCSKFFRFVVENQPRHDILLGLAHNFQPSSLFLSHELSAFTMCCTFNVCPIIFSKRKMCLLGHFAFHHTFHNSMSCGGRDSVWKDNWLTLRPVSYFAFLSAIMLRMMFKEENRHKTLR